jgi:hypothetical protein
MTHLSSVVPNRKTMISMPSLTSSLNAYFQTRPVIRAWLFGSQADGTATEESDVDILAELDYSQHIGLEFIQMIWDLEAIVGRKMDLVTADGLSPFIKPLIEPQKRLIYERQARCPVRPQAPAASVSS